MASETFGNRGIVQHAELICPGGVVVGNVRSRGGCIWRPTLVAKAVGDTLAAADLVSGLISVNSIAAPLTLEIPNVEPILAAFAANGQTMAVGDQFGVLFIRGPLGASDLTIAAAVAAGANHAVTWASGAAPLALTAGGATLTHVCRLIFEVTSLATPAIRIHSILG